MSQPWQSRALSYYDMIGEIRFASQFYAKLLSRVRFYPARQKEDGQTEPITSGPPVELMHRIQDPGGGRSRLQYDYGRMMFVTGEGILFASERDEVPEWRFLWKDEVRYNETVGAFERVRDDKQPYNPPEYGTAYRLWTPHPRHSDEADSPLRSVMDIAEELLILTLAVRSTAVSRMTNGIFKIPSELSMAALSTNYEGDEDPEQSQFLTDWIEHTEAAIADPGSAAARVPFMLEGAYEYLDKAVWMSTHDSQTDYMERELRKEAVHRLALGMDFPPEFLLGMTDSNHWTARQVVFDMWRSYGSPVAERFGDDLSDSYLRPALREEEYEGWEDVVVAFDDSQVVIAPDRTEDADKALDRAAIGFAAYRELKGIPESMAPSEEEQELLISMKLRQPIELEGQDMVIAQRGPVAQSNGRVPEDGPPSPNGGREVSRQEARTASARIHGAAQLALMRCRELAGVRIRHKCSECAEGAPPSLVAAALGPEQVADPLKLVQGGSDGLRSLLLEWGWDDAQSTALCQQLEVYAARTLFQSACPDLPSGFVAAIERAREASDAISV
ncbi:MAG TPA: hypothetical protein VLA89_10745 [Gemmatimonadales bacterium]|nr:hypothetical protein [Gemmatimonadales bacterium]